jgi:hypothetical protein
LNSGFIKDIAKHWTNFYQQAINNGKGADMAWIRYELMLEGLKIMR